MSRLAPHYARYLTLRNLPFSLCFYHQTFTLSLSISNLGPHKKPEGLDRVPLLAPEIAAAIGRSCSNPSTDGRQSPITQRPDQNEQNYLKLDLKLPGRLKFWFLRFHCRN
jgi:hypothetical protein